MTPLGRNESLKLQQAYETIADENHRHRIISKAAAKMNSRKIAQQRKHNQLVNQYLDSVAPLQIPSDTVIAPLRSNRSVSTARQGQQQQQQQQPSLKMQRRQSAATMGAVQPSSPSNLPAHVSSQSSISSAQSGSNNVSPVPAPNAAFGQASAQAQMQVVAGGAQQVGQASAAASAQAQAYQARLQQQVQARVSLAIYVCIVVVRFAWLWLVLPAKLFVERVFDTAR